MIIVYIHFIDVASKVGVGGQAVWLAGDREVLCRNVLKTNPLDFECLKSLATALVSRAYVQRNSRGDAEEKMCDIDDDGGDNKEMCVGSAVQCDLLHEAVESLRYLINHI